MDEEKIKISNRKIQNELEKISVSYSSLEPKVKEMIYKAEEFLEMQKMSFSREFKKTINVKYNIESFCRYIGISRAAIYKKNKSGLSNYEMVILYINLRVAEFEAYKNQTIKKYLRESDDVKLMHQLLTHEVEYQLMKEKLKDKNLEIQKLKSDLEFERSHNSKNTDIDKLN